jgi:hypothetical protein
MKTSGLIRNESLSCGGCTTLFFWLQADIFLFSQCRKLSRNDQSVWETGQALSTSKDYKHKQAMRVYRLNGKKSNFP